MFNARSIASQSSCFVGTNSEPSFFARKKQIGNMWNSGRSWPSGFPGKNSFASSMKGYLGRERNRCRGICRKSSSSSTILSAVDMIRFAFRILVREGLFMFFSNPLTSFLQSAKTFLRRLISIPNPSLRLLLHKPKATTDRTPRNFIMSITRSPFFKTHEAASLASLFVRDLVSLLYIIFDEFLPLMTISLWLLKLTFGSEFLVLGLDFWELELYVPMLAVVGWKELRTFLSRVMVLVFSFDSFFFCLRTYDRRLYGSRSKRAKVYE